MPLRHVQTEKHHVSHLFTKKKKKKKHEQGEKDRIKDSIRCFNKTGEIHQIGLMNQYQVIWVNASISFGK